VFRRLLVRQRHPAASALSVSRIDSIEVGRSHGCLKWTACIVLTIDLDRRREQVQVVPVFCLKRCQRRAAWCVPKALRPCACFTWGEQATKRCPSVRHGSRVRWPVRERRRHIAITDMARSVCPLRIRGMHAGTLSRPARSRSMPARVQPRLGGMWLCGGARVAHRRRRD